MTDPLVTALLDAAGNLHDRADPTKLASAARLSAVLAAARRVAAELSNPHHETVDVVEAAHALRDALSAAADADHTPRAHPGDGTPAGAPPVAWDLPAVVAELRNALVPARHHLATARQQFADAVDLGDGRLDRLDIVRRAIDRALGMATEIAEQGARR